MKNKIDLDNIKKIETEILKYIDDICQKNEIEYFVFAGTLIGTIRHKGFIPWDDDIDIALTRENYNKLLEVLKRENNNRFCLFDNSIQPEYYYPFAKVIDKRTMLVENNLREINNLGLYVDIFALDTVPEECAMRHYKKIKRKQALIKYYAVKESKEKNWFKKIIKRGILIYTSVVGVKRIIKQYDKLCTSYNQQDGKFMLCNWTTNSPDKSYIKSIDVKSGTKRAKFENIEVDIPKEYDGILRDNYGDYMKLPPEDQRINHCMEAYLINNEEEKNEKV